MQLDEDASLESAEGTVGVAHLALDQSAKGTVLISLDFISFVSPTGERERERREEAGGRAERGKMLKSAAEMKEAI